MLSFTEQHVPIDDFTIGLALVVAHVALVVVLAIVIVSIAAVSLADPDLQNNRQTLVLFSMRNEKFQEKDHIVAEASAHLPHTTGCAFTMMTHI